MREKLWLPGIWLALALAALACTLPGVAPAGPAPTPTPLGDTLTFHIPAYTYTLQPGDTIPGTELHYVGREGDAYKVTIDGLEAWKRSGDSFIWDGLVGAGVYASYNLRLTTAVFGPLPVAGSVAVTIFYPTPVALETLPDFQNALAYPNTVVNYLVPPGRQIPGTSLVYETMVERGEGDQVTRLAQLSGLTGYPNLAVGDSLTWTGQLRDNVFVQNSLRVISINEDGLRLAGISDLWVTQTAP